MHLLLNLIGPSEHVVDIFEVICTGEEGVGVALRGIILLQVGFLAEIAHLERGQSRDRRTISRK